MNAARPMQPGQTGPGLYAGPYFFSPLPPPAAGAASPQTELDVKPPEFYNRRLARWTRVHKP